MTTQWLIVGLGNPGRQYEETRHNVGFMVLERLARNHSIAGKGETRFNAIVGKGQVAGHPVVLAQPTTFMNLSGEAVSRLLQFYKIEPEHCLVIYDEAALPFGRLRIRPGGSAAGHNGIKSIIQQLGGNQNFPRLRIGIGEPKPASQHTEQAKPMHHHVLSRFDPDEQPNLPTILDAACEAIEVILADGIEPAMTRFNGFNLFPDSEPV